MSRLFILLTGYFLLSQPNYLVAPFIRSSVELSSGRAPTGNKGGPAGSEGAPAAGNEVPSGIKAPYLQGCCEKIIRSRPSIYFIGDRSGRMRFRLEGVYSHGPTLFFRLRFNNRSSLDYDIDSIRFCIIPMQGRGHTQRQGHPQNPGAPPAFLHPVYIYDSAVTVPGYQRVTTIYALARFTLSPGRQLQIIVGERNGGRGLRLQTSNYLLEKARPI